MLDERVVAGIDTWRDGPGGRDLGWGKRQAVAKWARAAEQAVEAIEALPASTAQMYLNAERCRGVILSEEVSHSLETAAVEHQWTGERAKVVNLLIIRMFENETLSMVADGI